MDKEQALHYAQILLVKLEAVKNRGNGMTIHDANQHAGTLDGYARLVKTNHNGALDWLNEAIVSTENFLANQWRQNE